VEFYDHIAAKLVDVPSFTDNKEHLCNLLLTSPNSSKFLISKDRIMIDRYIRMDIESNQIMVGALDEISYKCRLKPSGNVR
jgi:hypothetical protein